MNTEKEFYNFINGHNFKLLYRNSMVYKGCDLVVRRDDGQTMEMDTEEMSDIAIEELDKRLQ